MVPILVPIHFNFILSAVFQPIITQRSSFTVPAFPLPACFKEGTHYMFYLLPAESSKWSRTSEIPACPAYPGIGIIHPIVICIQVAAPFKKHLCVVTEVLYV